MTTSRNWMFTLNNPQEQITFGDNVKYAVWQKERGEITGTTHFQGYIEFKRTQTLQFVSRLLPHAHWEVRRGTQQQAIDYCTKQDGTYVEGPWTHGVLMLNQPGRRNDLLELKAAIDAGTSMTEIAQEMFPVMANYSRWAKEYRMLITPDRDTPPRIYILVGPPRTGKSRFCRRVAPLAYWKYPNKGESDWWDGYDGQPDVILDDFYGWIRYNSMLRLCDRYPYVVETKGGHAKFVSKRIFITSNVEPELWYSRVDNTAFLERLREFGIRITDYQQDLID